MLFASITEPRSMAMQDQVNETPTPKRVPWNKVFAHLMLAISMVSCAFATTGIMEVANARQINPLLIVVVLEVGSTWLVADYHG
jgi:hypothetical protein